ncbi:hypothetical protein Bca101_065802 [Brassica carinata]
MRSCKASRCIKRLIAAEPEKNKGTIDCWAGFTSMGCSFGWFFEDPILGPIAEGSQTTDHVSSPLMAEALAMREALHDAKRKAYSNVRFRSDSQELSRAINSKVYSVELFGVLMNIELLSSSFDFCFFFSFVGRENNATADSIAKAALANSSSILY